ncbi:AbrB/MazE/SpoVT family DNA-binding domain-containing protein [Thermofilum sp.]|jgi:AbrB family looped-hinge helix DNA binding protein|uniref:AbrB/MazE/SpoVT family DNA-binding domain-containing protein n=1 Tax=Thermofilum sp. TaxID=1961369 RepID=UPI0025896852|nr:AbrB/MazE/SpoVT family DNA-binding domain-containing protein [Thermofilum sp.]
MRPKTHVKVTRKGQVTIPLPVRKDLGIKEGDTLAVWEEDGKVILEKIDLPEPGQPVGQEAYKELTRELDKVREAWR